MPCTYSTVVRQTCLETWKMFMELRTIFLDFLSIHWVPGCKKNFPSFGLITTL